MKNKNLGQKQFVTMDVDMIKSFVSITNVLVAPVKRKSRYILLPIF